MGSNSKDVNIFQSKCWWIPLAFFLILLLDGAAIFCFVFLLWIVYTFFLEYAFIYAFLLSYTFSTLSKVCLDALFSCTKFSCSLFATIISRWSSHLYFIFRTTPWGSSVWGDVNRPRLPGGSPEFFSNPNHYITGECPGMIPNFHVLSANSLQGQWLNLVAHSYRATVKSGLSSVLSHSTCG